jgi:hypothetical protein
MVTPTSPMVGQTGTLKATVTATNGTPTGGTITFSAGGVTITTCTLSAGTCSVSLPTTSLAPGTYPVIASYGGTTDYAASTSTADNVVLGKSTTTTTVVVTPNPITSPATGTITATVKRPSGSAGFPTGSVTFYADGIQIGTGTLNGSGVATFSQPTSGISNGSYTISVDYAGDSNDDTSTGSVSVTVN